MCPGGAALFPPVVFSWRSGYCLKDSIFLNCPFLYYLARECRLMFVYTCCHFWFFDSISGIYEAKNKTRNSPLYWFLGTEVPRQFITSWLHILESFFCFFYIYNAHDIKLYTCNRNKKKYVYTIFPLYYILIINSFAILISVYALIMHWIYVAVNIKNVIMQSHW